MKQKWRGRAPCRLGDQITSRQPRRTAFIAKNSPYLGEDLQGSRDSYLARHGSFHLPESVEFVPGSVDIRPRLKKEDQDLSLSLAVQERKRKLPEMDSWQQREQGPVDTADSCEVQAARMGNIRRRTRGVGTSVIADSLRSEGLPERLAYSEYSFPPQRRFRRCPCQRLIKSPRCSVR